MPDIVSSKESALMNGERLFSPAAAAKASNVPGHRGGTHLNGSTVFRHIVKGVRIPNGEVVRLEAVRVGSRWLTSLEAITRFVAKLTQASIPADTSPSTPAVTPKQRSRSAAKASQSLDAVLGTK